MAYDLKADLARGEITPLKMASPRLERMAESTRTEAEARRVTMTSEQVSHYAQTVHLAAELRDVLAPMVEIATRRWRGLPEDSYEKKVLADARRVLAKHKVTS